LRDRERISRAWIDYVHVPPPAAATRAAAAIRETQSSLTAGVGNPERRDLDDGDLIRAARVHVHTHADIG
jgi:hypothetical protein